MSFTTLGLSSKVLAAIEAAGFKEPTPIQSQAIPVAMQGRDVVGIAQTGTGKTASFVLPMLTKLEMGRARARMPRSLILEPTRELAAQVAQSFEVLGTEHKLNIALIIGGVSFDEQDRKLDRGADILIATPGRLLDHFQRGKLLMTAVEILVIDEADRMLDMGFIPDIEKICKLLPANRQTLFFSATMPAEIQKLTVKFLNDPVRIAVAPQSTAAKTIVQRLKFAHPESKAKREALRELMRGQTVKNAIIFCNRKRDVDVIYKSLNKHGFNVGALHGDMDQRARTATLDGFRNGSITFLAASDVAARGLDIPEVSHVFNFDVPISPEDYIHRIGRTGRAGREGFAATIVTPDDIQAIRAVEALCKEKIEWMGEEPDAAMIEEWASTKKGKRGRTRGKKPEKTQERRTAPLGERGRLVRERSVRERSDAQTSAAGRSSDGRPAGDSPASRRSGLASHEQQRPAAPSRRENPKPGARAPEAAVVGLGDHVPAFLMRPTRPTK